MILSHCSHCSEKIKGSKHHHSGKTYCSSCFSLFYKVKQCVSCHKRRRIFYSLESDICDHCKYKDTPCSRCKKLGNPLGMVSIDGPVCRSCIIYYTEPKLCEWCNKYKRDVSNRTLDSGTEFICGGCYTNTLPICVSCGYRRKPFVYDFKRKPICRPCMEEDRSCKTCNTCIPAGSGNYCIECGYIKTLNNRILSGQKVLSKYFSNLYADFGFWLLERRQAIFSATHIKNYHPYFIQLDKMAVQLNRVPRYKEIVGKYTVALTRKNLLATTFLDEAGVITIDETIKKDYSNLNTIDRYLHKFEKHSFYYDSLHAYHSALLTKLNNGKTTIRSMRLALTPAVKLLDACEHFNLDKPNNDVLYGLLWVNPGQRATISGYINFLNKHYGLELNIPNRESIIIEKPKESKMILKQKLIQLLRNPVDSAEYKDTLLLTKLAYFHRISVPSFTIVDAGMVYSNHRNNCLINLCGLVLYTPV